MTVAFIAILARGSSKSGMGVTIIAAVVSLAAASWVAFRFATEAVSYDGDGVQVRNLWRTTTFPWSRIDRFTFGRCGLNPAIGILVDMDGGEHGMAAMQRSALWSAGCPDARQSEALAHLNAQIRR